MKINQDKCKIDCSRMNRLPTFTDMKKPFGLDYFGLGEERTCHQVLLSSPPREVDDQFDPPSAAAAVAAVTLKDPPPLTYDDDGRPILPMKSSIEARRSSKRIIKHMSKRITKNIVKTSKSMTKKGRYSSKKVRFSTSLPDAPNLDVNSMRQAASLRKYKNLGVSPPPTLTRPASMVPSREGASVVVAAAPVTRGLFKEIVIQSSQQESVAAIADFFSLCKLDESE